MYYSMNLQVHTRTLVGRGTSALRAKGIIPAELYGRGLANVHLSVPAKEFKKVFKEAGENTVVTVELDGKKHSVLIHDVSFDALSDEITSVDFYQVRMDEKLKIDVPVEFTGIAPAVKAQNGILVKSLHVLAIEALPAHIPHHIAVDVSILENIGQSIYVKDLTIPADVRVLVAPETVVATVTAQITEEEELKMQQEAAGGVETVKVESEEKKAEREAAKATETPAVPAEAAKEAPKK